MKELLKQYDIASHTKKGYILESKEEKIQSIDDDWNYIGREYLVYSKKEKKVIYKSHKYSECGKVLLSL